MADSQPKEEEKKVNGKNLMVLVDGSHNADAAFQRPDRPTFPFCRWRLKFFKPPHTLAKTLTKTLTKTLHHTLHAWYRHEKEEARKEGKRQLLLLTYCCLLHRCGGRHGGIPRHCRVYFCTCSCSCTHKAPHHGPAHQSLRRPPPVDDRALAANQVMDILGAESGRLYSEDSIIIELAKWGFAAITHIRQDTKAISILTPSSTPAHVTFMLGEVQELFNLTSRSATLLDLPNLQSLSPFEGASFEILRKIMAGETVRFVPMCTRRRGQEQLRLAYQSGDDEVWECRKCDPPTYHVLHIEHRGKKHICRSRTGGAQPHKIVQQKVFGQAISVSLDKQPKRLQKNLQVLVYYRQQRASFIAVCIILFRLVNSRVSFPPNRENCNCVPLFCRCPHRTPVYNPITQIRFKVPELRLWWYRQLASFVERPFLVSEWKVTVTPPLRSEWTRLMNLMWILDRTNKLWAKCVQCGEQKSPTKRLAALQDREEKLRRENKSFSDLDEQEKTEIRRFFNQV
eukprot:g67531.t1